MKKIVLYQEKKDCCGCGACVSICPQKAILMEEDEYGFRYPSIDHSRCIKCGMCRRACAYQTKKPNRRPVEAYAAVCKKRNY